MTLRTKFFLWISALLTVTILGVGSLMLYSERRALITEADQRHRQLLQSLKQICEESLYKTDDLVFFNYISTLKTERGFRAASFVDGTGHARIHSNPEKTGQYLSSPKDKEMGRLTGDFFAQRYRLTDGEDVLDLAAPVFFAEERVGTARLFLSQRALDDFLTQSAWRTLKKIGYVLCLTLLLGFLGAFWLTKTLVSPIQLVVAGMKQVSTGHLNPISFPRRRDEIGWMGEEINKTISKLKELDEMKRDFVASVTHELRSPLAAVESVHRFILDEGQNASEKDRRFYLIRAQNNVSRLAHLIDDLLAAAKVEANKVDLNEDEFDIAHLVTEICNLYRPHAAEKKIELVTEIPNGEIMVWGDTDKTTQILNNLVSNAFKYTDKGHVKIRVQADTGEVLVQVSDTGLGIPAEDRDQLFQKFYRSKSSAKKKHGTGLGLYIAKAFVELQKGRIWVSSHEEGGTVFSFTLQRNPPVLDGPV